MLRWCQTVALWHRRSRARIQSVPRDSTADVRSWKLMDPSPGWASASHPYDPEDSRRALRLQAPALHAVRRALVPPAESTMRGSSRLTWRNVASPCLLGLTAPLATDTCRLRLAAPGGCPVGREFAETHCRFTEPPSSRAARHLARGTPGLPMNGLIVIPGRYPCPRKRVSQSRDRDLLSGPPFGTSYSTGPLG